MKDRRQRRLPAIAQHLHDGVGDESVLAHIRRDGKGRLAYAPIIKVPQIVVRMVATMEASGGMPAAFRIAGLTAKMYDMVMNVVPPANSSRPKVVPHAGSRSSG